MSEERRQGDVVGMGMVENEMVRLQQENEAANEARWAIVKINEDLCKQIEALTKERDLYFQQLIDLKLQVNR